MKYIFKEVKESNSEELLERLINKDMYVGRDPNDILRMLKGREGFSYEACQGKESVNSFIDLFFEGLCEKEQVKNSAYYILLIELGDHHPILMTGLAIAGSRLRELSDRYDGEERALKITSRIKGAKKTRMMLVCLNDVKVE